MSSSSATPIQLSRRRLTPKQGLKVALVSMPFQVRVRPSIQISLLAGYAIEAGHEVDQLSLNLELAARMDLDRYDMLCNQGRNLFLGDFVFAAEAFGDDAPPIPEDLEILLATESGPEGAAQLAEDLIALRVETIPAYLDHLMESIDWGSYDVVGFTSTFQQTAASLAMARRIKSVYPEPLMLFGGANFEGVMGQELVRSIDTVDYAISGEADVSFPEFLAAVSSGKDPTVVPGVIGRRDGEVVFTEADMIVDLDQQPALDYDEYFARSERLDLLDATRRNHIWLPYESSRGCWWGAKAHCTFCGLNGSTMSFRSKGADKVLEELWGLARRYHVTNIEVVDNIVETSYLESVFPTLTELDNDFTFFLEVKADMSRNEIATLRDAGVTVLQPGIESMNSHVLSLMRKGTRSSWNVNMLRWTLYHGIDTSWNVLCGFPGETEDDYIEQEELFADLHHLQPGGGVHRIWMERYSPIFTKTDKYPSSDVTPVQGYQHMFPEYVDHAEAAYFFDYELENTLPDSAFEGTRKALHEWQTAWQRASKPKLTVIQTPDFIRIDDDRSDDRRGSYSFEGPMARLYRAAMDRPVRAKDIIEQHGLSASEAAVEQRLDEFCDAGLMMRDRKLYLSLAIPKRGSRMQEVHDTFATNNE